MKDKIPATKIGKKNEQMLRSGDFGPYSNNPMRATSGVLDLGTDAIGEITLMLMQYDDFNSEHDPFGNRDFGSLNLPSITDNDPIKIYFQIDQVENKNSQITLMLPSER